MNRILDGLRIIEGSAFVAAPLGGMTLAQMGADVIRFDPLSGGLDAHRWPVTQEGRSLYWAGLNKGKRSLAVDTRQPEGREIVTALIGAEGEGNGIYLSNFPSRGWQSYEALKAKRDDVIVVNLLGNPDGTSAVDYTVNCAVGFPFVTGMPHGNAPVNPVNHVLPAWDAIAGIHLSLAIVAAERYRRVQGAGQHVQVALADIAIAMAGNLGYIQEVQINHQDRRAHGNYLYGSYGCDFETLDGRRIYIVVVTDRMWVELGKATGLAPKFTALEALLAYDFGKEGDRFKASDAITAILKPWCEARTLAQIGDAFDGTGVCWGPYQTFTQLVEQDPRCSTANPMFSELDQPGIGRYLVPGSPLSFSESPRQVPVRAPLLGEHTDEILGGELGFSDRQIGELRDRRVVGGPIDVV